MFGSIGGPEVILLFIAALLLFGPRRLPEIGRTLGKTMADFRRATNDFRVNLEREVQVDEIKKSVESLDLTSRPETLARGLLDVTPSPEPEPAAPSADTPADDGGPGSVH